VANAVICNKPVLYTPDKDTKGANQASKTAAPAIKKQKVETKAPAAPSKPQTTPTSVTCASQDF
jgi:hypothetical protein